VPNSISIEQSVRKFIKENLLYGDTEVLLDGNASFLQAGLIDSTGILQLVTFLEEEFAFRVADSEVLPENLDSVTRIVGYVGRKMNGQPAGETHAG